MDGVRCCNCQYYAGVHNCKGNAPCEFWDIGVVMWDDFCSRWKHYQMQTEEGLKAVKRRTEKSNESGQSNRTWQGAS